MYGYNFSLDELLCLIETGEEVKLIRELFRSLPLYLTSCSTLQTPATVQKEYDHLYKVLILGESGTFASNVGNLSSS